MTAPAQAPIYSVEAAYLACEQLTRTEARNFSWGIRLLDAPRRKAMCALYALARRIDDIGDRPTEGADPTAKLAALGQQRMALEALMANDPGVDPVMVALSDVAKHYPVPLEAFAELIDGCEADVIGRRYETIEELIGYCRNVAGSIGRLSLGVFGYSDPGAPQLADSLGVALQLTNILRDIATDRDELGRIYIPRSDIERFGCDEDLSAPRAKVASLVRFEASRASKWFAEGLELLPLLDRRSRACVATMAGIYRRLLARIEADPQRVMSERVSVPALSKLSVAARAIALGAP